MCYAAWAEDQRGSNALRPGILVNVKRHKYISDDVEWKSKPGEPLITGPGDLLAMMAQGSTDSDESRAESENGDRAPTRKAIISIHGKDVEECEVPRRRPKKDRAA